MPTAARAAKAVRIECQDAQMRLASPLNLVACWNDALSFDHQDHRSSRRPGSVHHSLGHRESLLGIELHGAPLQIDDEFALDDIEEFIFLVVLVPVKFTLYHAEANDAIIHLAE